MKKLLLFLFSLCVGGALLIWIINEIGWEEIKSVFWSFSIWKWLAILILTVLAALIKGWRWKTILKSQGYDIPAIEVFEYYLSGSAVSFLIPMVILGGEIFRCYDLKEKYSLPWLKSIASVVIDRILEITVFAIATIFGVIFFILKVGLPSEKTGIFIFSLIFLAILAIAIFYFKSFKKESIIYFFIKRVNFQNSTNVDTAMDIEKEIFNYFRPNKRTMLWGFGLSVLSGAVMLGRTMLLISFLGKSIGLSVGISVLAFSYLATTLPIPAAIGSHEVIQSFVFRNMELGANTGAAFALIICSAELMLALIGSVFLIKFFIQMLENTVVKTIKNLFKR
ncbi:MAG: hypothetical protein COX90_01790 [Candidatus Nealsonbacteria bacterium CG_4_10_14_0_2_um_filter_38_17]|uniref:Flippase-like domain-containing protein n=2 Tax=Candidatus Nealsoniibacteriota TaxID=1817911 RepID=A0A2M7UYA8_9BACT|nr:MAG: hypothetical protein COX36_04410 [Candidatus Nealsonbacteria bacterium CG23_combo_of_CG06-09_8_20_14_all_38_19]PIZ88954.1 MAG: hypothetical protein COX90_01790 [Candidatus Nealsonbacteria bacterium CG_4_10_14_0_2_um_filter_38_17]